MLDLSSLGHFYSFYDGFSCWIIVIIHKNPEFWGNPKFGMTHVTGFALEFEHFLLHRRLNIRDGHPLLVVVAKGENRMLFGSSPATIAVATRG